MSNNAISVWPTFQNISSRICICISALPYFLSSLQLLFVFVILGSDSTPLSLFSTNLQVFVLRLHHSISVYVCVKRLWRTTLPLNWVVGNTLLWQLLFAGPGAKNCFFAYSLSLFFFSLFFLRSLCLFLHLLLSFSSSLCSSARSLSISHSVFLFHSPLLSFFSLVLLAQTTIPSPFFLFISFCHPFCLCGKHKELASICWTVNLSRKLKS